MLIKLTRLKASVLLGLVPLTGLGLALWHDVTIAGVVCPLCSLARLFMLAMFCLAILMWFTPRKYLNEMFTLGILISVGWMATSIYQLVGTYFPAAGCSASDLAQIINSLPTAQWGLFSADPVSCSNPVTVWGPINWIHLSVIGALINVVLQSKIIVKEKFDFLELKA